MNSTCRSTEGIISSLEAREIRKEIQNGIPNRVSQIEEITDHSTGGRERIKKSIEYVGTDDGGDFLFLDEDGIKHHVSPNCFPYQEWNPSPYTIIKVKYS